MPERGFDSCVKQSGSNPLLARCIIIPVWRVMQDKVRLQFPLFPQLRGSKTQQNSAEFHPTQVEFPNFYAYFPSEFFNKLLIFFICMRKIHTVNFKSTNTVTIIKQAILQSWLLIYFLK
jgi:hypothetical protein